MQLQQAYRQDPDFSCRHPVYAAYFSRRGEMPAPGKKSCADTLPVRMLGREKGWYVQALDPDRVSEIQLIFIGQHGGGASRFGHVALRLIVCPDAGSTARQCALNVDEHVFLGFQAHVDDSQISLWRGILGGYTARLNAQPFIEAYEHYSSGEFRELRALPLKLTAAERKHMLAGLVQTHWSHASEYRFFTRNCATLLQDSLAALWPAFTSGEEGVRQSLRPDRFFDNMRKSALIGHDPLADLVQAERSGHYFPSNEAAFRQAALHVRKSLPSPFFSSLDDYLDAPAVLRREALLKVPGDARTRSARILMEEWALLQTEKHLLAAATSLWELNRGELRYKGRSTLSPEQMSLFRTCILGKLQSLITPPAAHDGIPVQTVAQPGIEDSCSAHEKQQLANALQQEVGQQASAWQPLLGTLRELDEILTTLIALHATPTLPMESLHVQPG